MVRKYNRIKSQQHVRLYKVQLISVTYGSVLYSVAFEFAPTSAAPTTGKSRWLSGNMLV